MSNSDNTLRATQNQVVSRSFLCGACEGFYGKPWTYAQREELFRRLNRFQLNAYLYAPKDDYKHRICWRDLYADNECCELRNLIRCATANGVTFIYAISPGLDISYTSTKDLQALKNKLSQVRSLGCNAFALLFDDIEPDLDYRDAEVYESPADAAAAVTNEMYAYLDKPPVFLFCPTEYCTSRASPDLIRSKYLLTLGKKLDPAIDILWTGARVVSNRITSECIREVSQVLQRQPIIWDNLHANDYDRSRIYLGPYDGRAAELQQCLRGVLVNPNCEFEANFIVTHTLGQWRLNTVCTFPVNKRNSVCGGDSVDVDMADTSKTMPVPQYQATRALHCAVADWIPEFYKVKGTSGAPSHFSSSSHQLMDATDNLSSSSERVDELASSDKEQNSDTHRKKFVDAEPLETEDVLLLCDIFYLPYEHGPRGLHLLKRAHSLISHVDVLTHMRRMATNSAASTSSFSSSFEQKNQHSDQSIDQTKSLQQRGDEAATVTSGGGNRENGIADEKEWYEKAISFHERYKEVTMLVDKFVNVPNRELLYELYNYVNDMRCVLSFVNSYIKWNGTARPDKDPFVGGEQEPWVNHGGLLSEFRRLLPSEGEKDIYPRVHHSIPVALLVVPYLPSNREAVYEVCRKTFDESKYGVDICRDVPDLPGDSCVGALLSLYPQHCYVLEMDGSVVGFVAMAMDARDYQQRRTDGWLVEMRSKYRKKSEKNATADNVDVEEAIDALHAQPAVWPQHIYTKYPGYVELRVMGGRLDSSPAALRRLMDFAVRLMKSHSLCGVHSVVREMDVALITAFLKLGFEEVASSDDHPSDGLVVMARPF